ncbi:MAG: DoxX family protein [Propionibacteriaceae bacterium]|nr:DoxX family protein [Propionibacteriaceae bacterium]
MDSKIRTGNRDWKNWVSLAARLILGVVVIWAGLSKVGNLAGSVQSTSSYQILSYDLAQFVGYALPFAEIALGIVLILGLFTRVMGALGALLMLGFVIAIASVWARGISIDCGCFGNGGPVDPSTATAGYPWEILRDVALMACGIWLVFAKPFLAVDSWLFRPVEDIIAQKDRKKRR